jgi:SRSO17 transposase
MTPQQMQQVRPRLAAFAAQMLGGLARRDQRATGELYVRGLLTDGQRKSMQPMAERLGVDHQRLQQFITPSSWDDAEVRRRLAQWAQQTIGPDAWVIDDVGFPRTAGTPRVWRGCTAGRWARPATARSG